MERKELLERILEEGRGGVLFQLYVKTGMDREALVLEGGELVFYTREIPEKGRANASLIRFLSRGLKIPSSRIEIVYGLRSHVKKILIKDIDRETLIGKLSKLVEEG